MSTIHPGSQHAHTHHTYTPAHITHTPCISTHTQISHAHPHTHIPIHHTQGESDYTCIGNDITNVEAVRSSLKNQFDRNLVSNFVYQEQIFDYTFSHLGLHEESSVAHPVVLTEPVCNPSYCR